MNATKFALVLKQCRENAGLTQKQTALALGMERSTYAYYETGVSQPSALMVVKLAKLFGVPEELFMDAVADVEFGSSPESEKFTTLSDKSWEEREKMYTLSSEEQYFLSSYRLLMYDQQNEIKELIRDYSEKNTARAKDLKSGKKNSSEE